MVLIESSPKKLYIRVDVPERPDIATAVSDNKSKAVSKSTTGGYSELQGICFSQDGKYLYYCDLSTAGSPVSYLYQYTLSTNWDISTATETAHINYNTVTSYTQPSGIAISDDGNYLFVTSGGNGRIIRLTLSTPFDLTTASKTEDINTGGNLTGISFSDNGTKLYYPNYSQSRIIEYSLTSPRTLTGMTNVGYTAYPVGGSVYRDCMVSPLGDKVYIIKQDGNAYQMDMSTPFDITTATYNNVTKSFFNNACGMFVSPDGKKLYIGNISTYTIYQYSLG